jgi:hypothetical protein
VDGSDIKALGHRYKHCPVFDIDHFRRRHLSEVEGGPIKVSIRLAIVDKAAGIAEISGCLCPFTDGLDEPDGLDRITRIDFSSA